MRCDARLLCNGGCESAARTAPPGAPEDFPPEAPLATSAIAANAAIAHPLTQRSARSLIKEVQVLGVDGDRDVVAELQVHVRRERCDEVRSRADDGLLALAQELLLLGVQLGLDLARVDVEVPHRLAAD